jgi:hypothetical protein
MKIMAIKCFKMNKIKKKNLLQKLKIKCLNQEQFNLEKVSKKSPIKKNKTLHQINEYISIKKKKKKKKI